MRRTSSQHRFAGAAPAALLLALLAACQGDGANAGTFVASASAPSAPASFASPAMPPPPGLAAKAPAAAPPADIAGGSAASLAEAHDRLEAALAKAASCNADAQCRSLPVGGKACGGPTGYRAYNPQAAAAAQIPGLAAREHDLALQEARGSHRASNCLMTADPGARCEAGRCVTGTAGGAGP